MIVLDCEEIMYSKDWYGKEDVIIFDDWLKLRVFKGEKLKIY